MILRLKIKVRRIRSWLRRQSLKRQFALEERAFRKNRRKVAKQIAALPMDIQELLTTAWLTRTCEAVRRSLSKVEPLLSEEEELAHWELVKNEALQGLTMESEQP